jgi:hypothetical protein
MRPIYLVLGSLLFWALFAWALLSVAHAHDWADDPAQKAWFENLKQPDQPAVSCCGESDAYWADSFVVSGGGEYVAIITDTRDDKLPDGRTRHHRPVGTKIVVPNAKIKWDEGNPTGHGIIFMPAYDATLDGAAIPYCYLPPGGV